MNTTFRKYCTCFMLLFLTHSIAYAQSLKTNLLEPVSLGLELPLLPKASIQGNVRALPFNIFSKNTSIYAADIELRFYKPMKKKREGRLADLAKEFSYPYKGFFIAPYFKFKHIELKENLGTLEIDAFYPGLNCGYLLYLGRKRLVEVNAGLGYATSFQSSVPITGFSKYSWDVKMGISIGIGFRKKESIKDKLNDFKNSKPKKSLIGSL